MTRHTLFLSISVGVMDLFEHDWQLVSISRCLAAGLIRDKVRVGGPPVAAGVGQGRHLRRSVRRAAIAPGAARRADLTPPPCRLKTHGTRYGEHYRSGHVCKKHAPPGAGQGESDAQRLLHRRKFPTCDISGDGACAILDTVIT